MNAFQAWKPATVTPNFMTQSANNLSTTQSVAALSATAPAQPVVAAKQPTSTPLQVGFSPSATAVTPSATTPNTTTTNTGLDPLWANTQNGIGQAYQNTLTGALNGSIYDPFAAGQQESEARSEANARARTASQVASTGFSGTGIGQQAGSATEDSLLKQRFSNNNAIEQNKVTSQLATLPQAQSYAAANTTALNNAQSLAKTNFAATIANIPPNQPLDAATVAGNQALMSQGQQAWQAQGGQGQVSAQWVAQQASNMRQESDTTMATSNAIDAEVTNGTYTAAEGATLKQLANNSAVLASYKVDPTTGKMVPDLAKMETALGLPAGTLTGNAASVKGTDNSTITVPTTTKSDGTKYTEGDAFVGSDGSMYTIQNGVPTATKTSDLTFESLQGQSADSPAVKLALSKMTATSPADLWSQNGGSANTLVNSGKMLCVTDPNTGKPVLAKMVSSWDDKQARGVNRGMMSFQTTDGQIINIPASDYHVTEN